MSDIGDTAGAASPFSAYFGKREVPFVDGGGKKGYNNR